MVNKDNSITAQIDFGEALFLEGKIQESKNYFLDLLGWNPSDPDILNNLGVICHAQGENDAAEKYFLQAIEIDGNHLDARMNIENLLKSGSEGNRPVTHDEKETGFDYKLFWNDRYKDGGNSGLGSYGVLADFKAGVINEFMRNNFIDSAIEFGCGDGNQISSIDYPSYAGLDISEAAINLCKNRFKQDSSKKFFVFDPSGYKELELAEADLVVCLDVLYHILEEDDFTNTLDAIFRCSKKYVILYTMLHEPSNQVAAHIKYRDIYSYTNKYSQFEVFNVIDQKYPDLSAAAFIIFKKKDLKLSLTQGEYLVATGNLNEAEKCFKSLLDKNPDHLEALNDIGVVAFLKSDFEHALKYFKKALEIDKSYPDAIENYSKSLIALGDHLGALNFIRKSFNLGIINSKLLNLMGECFIEFKDLKSAKTVFEKSLSLYPDQQDVASLLCKIESAMSGDFSMDQPAVSNERMNIGFVSIWFERGQSYVTKILRDILSRQHNTFVFARTGGVYGEPKLEKSGYWEVPNLTTYPEYKIPAEILKKWITDNRLQAIVFNEEYDWDLVNAAKETGIKVLTYLDYYKDEWKSNMDVYDAVLCSTHRTYNLVKNVCKASYIGWCVDLDLFKPVGDDAADRYTFFHNAGWLGINYRKMTPAVILAFDAISRIFQDASLLVHSQAELKKMPLQIVDIIKSNPRIEYHFATVKAPGLYHKGKILVFPSKLEGLGLPLPEGLACGLPAIVTDAPPMNEFIKNGYNGMLVKVAHRIIRHDNISFPEEIVDINDLALKMAEALKNPGLIHVMGQNARRYAETELNPATLEKRLNNLIQKI